MSYLVTDRPVDRYVDIILYAKIRQEYTSIQVKNSHKFHKNIEIIDKNRYNG